MTSKETTKTKETLEANRFYHRAVQYLREEFPDTTKDKSEDELKEFIFNGCQKAVSYGLESQEHAMSFVDLQWRISPSFDTDEATNWSKEILSDDELDSEMKIATIRNAWALQESIKEEQ